MTRPALSAEKIADEALRLIDAEGMEAFSFRTLAARLSCQAMSLYHYFPSKQHLFQALIDRLIQEAADFPDTGEWQALYRQAAQAWREMAVNHPGFYPYFAQFRLNHRAGLALLDRQLAIFDAAGLSPKSRARHFRAFGFYLNGACLDEVTGPLSPGATEPMPVAEAALAFPGLMAAAPFFAPERRLTTFQHGLEVMIRAIEVEIGARTRA
ncbi:TetR family transcriptional regulator [Rhodobacter sp. KR11]|uniref:TetR family transcriptional regulator n=1 Tax=Rhodobacter sp. KR11 TaxID=2974588 RepID=UPI00222277E4|nr:TetR family transcriptional regulator [Rhodobacter sp. KR11]MCW1918656.1 TetR family transcriptional regulator [Rhodobacter sp. KR11]